MKRRLGTFLLTLLLLLALSPAALAAEPVRVAVIDTGVSSAVVDYANHALSKN